MKQQMIEFLKRNYVCKPGLIWAKKNCESLQDCWDKAKPEWLIWLATGEGVLDNITLRRFACFCARQSWNLLTDERSRSAVEVAERYCAGKATDEELMEARAAAEAAGAAWVAEAAEAAEVAWVAARAAKAAWVAARAAKAAEAAWEAAWVAARAAKAAEAAWEAAEAAEVAWAARAAARAARVAEAAEAAEVAQAAWLRKNAKPNFGEAK